MFMYYGRMGRSPYEHLSNIAKSDPVACATYAKENNLFGLRVAKSLPGLQTDIRNCHF